MGDEVAFFLANPEKEALLLHYARYSTAAQLETICRKYQTVQRVNAPDAEREAAYRRVSRRELDDGLIKVEAVLRPDEAALLWAAIEQATRDVSAETRSRADGLMAIAQRFARGESADRTPVELVVTVAKETLSGADHDPAAVSDGTLVSAETARRLACDCGVAELVEDPAGHALSVGRKSRTIPAAIKRALLHRDDHTYRFPGCTSRRFIDGHYILHWANGGETSLENLVSLCNDHHGFVHEHGYRVELDTEQTPTFFDARNRRVDAVPPPRPPRAWGGDLSPSPTTGRCLWDGRPADYSAAIDGLLSLDA